MSLNCLNGDLIISVPYNYVLCLFYLVCLFMKLNVFMPIIVRLVRFIAMFYIGHNYHLV